MKKNSWIERVLLCLALASAILAVAFHFTANDLGGDVNSLREEHKIIQSFESDQQIKEMEDKQRGFENASRSCAVLFVIFSAFSLTVHLTHRYRRITIVELPKTPLDANEIVIPQDAQVSDGSVEADINSVEGASVEENKVDKRQKEQKLARYTIRSRMNNDFCGPEDCIYNRFWEDVDEIVRNYQKPTGLRALLGGIASFVYRADDESHHLVSFASDTTKKEYMSYQMWIATFFRAAGVELKGEYRESDFVSFDIDTDAPQMRYFKVDSWARFKDPEYCKKYLEEN